MYWIFESLISVRQHRKHKLSLLGGDQPEACGYTGFQLFKCEDEFPVLDIPPLAYRVLDLNISTRTLRVARQDLLNDACPGILYSTTLNNLYEFAPDSNDENVTLFFGCVRVRKNGLKTSLPNQFACIDLFTIGNASSGPGPNIKCNDSISVPVNRAAAQALKNSTASSNADVLQEAFAAGFLIQWLTAPVRMCTDRRCNIYPGSQWNTQVTAAPSPVYQEEPRGAERHQRSQRIYIVVGAVSGAGVIIPCIIICCCYLIRQRSQQSGPDNENIENFLLQHGSLAPKRYKYSEIRKITKSFKDKLGRGGYGSVYQGVLPDGCPVAVKVLIDSDSNGEEFINEVASISRTSHVNIVNLLGFCYGGNKRALVYEFMPNKSLDKFINNNGDCQLDLEKLYKIAVGVAKGLEYLHTGCNTRIVHFDIKPQNILLDDDFCPKISDFGLAKLCKKKQSMLSVFGARGTIGYIAPEVFSRNFGGVSHKSDVYSYGMMVLEMAGAKKIVESEATGQSSENYFPDRIYEQVVLNVSTTLEDVMIEEEEETSRRMFLVGFWCIQTNPSDRPSMSKVVEMLEGSLQSIPVPPKPFLFTPSFPTSGQETSSMFSAHVEMESSVEA
ncbi:UNVERIFIED_CONTAM: LEAF RUST 10 DISEASE-RESISTANCE LOCUS RECEPTOR-LIKE PROTEIN KINASE-like 2.1 [Sesamum calycinum]|uniref:LEAF RUST 10 DISEASE-RESISTANCE LOCUS RECEPTOR-LIKE PROTEIN KINASE-like 2.1 n=1 Tax=Sesamum calycinum TaxID=2727403 RepID=A0AAW2STL7_9LAMI